MLLPVMISACVVTVASILNASHRGQCSDRVFTLFLATLAFTIFLVLLSELCQTNAYLLITFLSLCNPNLQTMMNQSPMVRSRVLHNLQMNMIVMERHTRIIASVLALCALVFVWYRILLVVLEQLVRAWRSIVSVQKSDAPHSSSEDTDEESSTPRTSQFFICSLILIVIVNDALYNRGLSTTTVFTSSAPSSILSSVLTRFISMATRAFVVCVAEVVLLVLVSSVMTSGLHSGTHKLTMTEDAHEGTQPSWYGHGQGRSPRREKDLEHGF